MQRKKFNKAIKRSYLPYVGGNAFDAQKFFLGFDTQDMALGREAFFFIDQEFKKQHNRSLKILLPYFICRDLPDVMDLLGIEKVYYQVEHNLKINLEQIRAILESSKIDGFLLVNYFGFSYDIDALKSLLKEFNVFLIEDNAHGFGSQDLKHAKLGLRGDYGIFSFRKSYPMINGALLASREILFLKKKQQFVSSSFKRKIFKKIAGIAVQVIGASRFVSIIKKSRQGVSATVMTKFELDQPINFYSELSYLNLEENNKNKKRLYQGLLEKSKELGLLPLFPKLEEGCVPYCFPFSPMIEIAVIEKKLNEIGMEIFHWPDLTEESRMNLEPFFLNIWAVRLIW